MVRAERREAGVMVVIAAKFEVPMGTRCSCVVDIWKHCS